LLFADADGPRTHFSTLLADADRPRIQYLRTRNSADSVFQDPHTTGMYVCMYVCIALSFCTILVHYLNASLCDDMKLVDDSNMLVLTCVLLLWHSALVRECHKCIIIVACQQFRACNSEQIDVFLCCCSRPVIESCSSMRFACHRYHYPLLEGI